LSTSNLSRAKFLGALSLVMSFTAILTAVVIMTVVTTVAPAIFSAWKDHATAVYANVTHSIGGIGMREEKDIPPVEAEELPWEFE